MDQIHRNSYPGKVMSICHIFNENMPHRQERFFIKPVNFKLKKSEHPLLFSGANLYNLMCNLINASTEPDELALQNRSINSFKRKIISYLLNTQSLGEESMDSS